MAEYVFKDMIKRLGIKDDFSVSSSATSNEAVGCDIYSPAKKCLHDHGVSFNKHCARRFTEKDYEEMDHIFIMERRNFVNLCRIIRDDSEGKIHLLREFDANGKDIADPWYTGDFETAYNDIRSGCIGVLKHLGYDTSTLD